MPDTENKKVNSLTLFFIGLTAGFIAASLPRLAPFIAQAGDTVSLDLLTQKFYVITLVFSIMIGVSMIWLYKGTKEHTKTLFLSALALPSVLSGALNTSNISAISSQKLTDLDFQTQVLQTKLKNQNTIEIINIDSDDIEFTPLSFIPAILGISDAYADNHAVTKKNNAAKNKIFKKEDKSNQSIVVNARSLDKKYIIMFGGAANKVEAKTKMKELNKKNITNIVSFKIKNKIYLLQGKRLTKTNALIESIDIKEKYGVVTKIINLN